MDFVHDQLFDGRPFRILTVVDQLSRESPLLEVDFAMSGQRVAETLETRTTDMPAPVSIAVDHGSEFTSKALEERAWRRSVELDFIRPGKPMENGHIESFSGRLRDECLNVMQFMSLDDARAKIEAWRVDYNQRRPPQLTGPPDTQRARSKPSGEPGSKVSRTLDRNCLRTGATIPVRVPRHEHLVVVAGDLGHRNRRCPAHAPATVADLLWSFHLTTH
jgi:transposase InsO family protein